jgi:CDP-glycerol glycerophosphotransferase (TagB/SpsB family)
MSYTQAADVYIGDVSSQVYEFIVRPRPCIFLNFEGRDWKGDETYAHWRLGQVIDRLDQLGPALERARSLQPRIKAAQRKMVEYSIDRGGEPASERQARAILTYARGAR